LGRDEKNPKSKNGRPVDAGNDIGRANAAEIIIAMAQAMRCHAIKFQSGTRPTAIPR